MKNKQLTINFIANIVAFIINIALTFILTPYIVSKVGSEAYGFVPLANNMINYVAIFTAALNSMAGRYISIEINSNNNEKANIYFNSVLRANTIIAIILIVPSILATLYINRIFNIPLDMLSDVQLTFIFVYINIIIALAGNVFSVSTFCKNRLELTAYRNIEGNIIKLVITLLLFLLFNPKIYFITLTSIAVTLYTIFTNIHYTKKLLPEIKISLKDYSSSAIRILIKSGLWNSVNQLSVVLLTNLDLMIANILIGSSLAGQYSLAKTIPSFITSFIGSVVSVFVPQFTILYAMNKQTELLKNINFSIKVVGLIVVIPISFLIIFGDTFFSLWLPGEDTQLLYLLSNLTLIPMIVTGSINPIFNVYTVTDKLKIPALVLLITGIVNTIITIVVLNITTLDIIAIPLVSLVIGLIRNLIFTPLYAAYCLKIKWWSLYLSISKGVICSIITMAISLVLKFSITVNTWLVFFIAAILCGGAALIINFFIMFDKNERYEALGIFRKKHK